MLRIVRLLREYRKALLGVVRIKRFQNYQNWAIANIPFQSNLAKSRNNLKIPLTLQKI